LSLQLPGVRDKELLAAWRRCQVYLDGLSKPAAAAVDRAKEVVVIHPVVRAAVNAILEPGDGVKAPIRCFGDVVAADRIPVDQVKPDLVFTSARDAQPTLLSSVFFIENKLVGKISDAVVQCVAYLRRVLRERVNEWHGRRESGGIYNVLSEDSIKELAKLFALGAACDGGTIQLVRVASGVPEACRDLGLVTEKESLPACTSPALPFLPVDADFLGGQVRLGKIPSDGFRALFCLLRLAEERLSPDAAPLTSITTSTTTGIPAGKRRRTATKEEYALGQRLGRGGFADVYEGTIDLKPVVVKVARSTTKGIVEVFQAEAACLCDLSGKDGLFPVLFRHTEVEAASTHVKASLRTPVLVFSRPICATPLLVHLQRNFRRVKLEKFADKVVRQLLKTVKVRLLFVCSPRCLEWPCVFAIQSGV
jgi:hypothetical protein